MFRLYSLATLLTIACVVHVIRTGQNTTWIWVIGGVLFIPFLGPLVYFCAVILPDLMGSRSGRRAVRGLRDTLNPEAELRRLENDVKVTGDVGSRQRYADELVRLGRPQEAVDVYKSCLTGLFADDPKLLLGYARSLFAAGDAAGARQHRPAGRQATGAGRAVQSPPHYRLAQLPDIRPSGDSAGYGEIATPKRSPSFAIQASSSGAGGVDARRRRWMRPSRFT